MQLTIDSLKKEKLIATKAKNKVRSTAIGGIVATLINKQYEGEVVDEKMILNTITKNIVSNKDNIKVYESRGDQAAVDHLQAEIEVFESLLPPPLTEHEIADAIRNSGAQSMKEMKVAMAYLKDNFVGRYEGSVAAKIARKVLS